MSKLERIKEFLLTNGTVQKDFKFLDNHLNRRARRRCKWLLQIGDWSEEK